MVNINQFLYLCETYQLLPWLEDNFESDYELIDDENKTKHKLSTLTEDVIFEQLEYMRDTNNELILVTTDERIVLTKKVKV